MKKHIAQTTANGSCAVKHTEKSLVFRIQKRNSRERSFAVIVHSECISLFEEAIEERCIWSKRPILYLSGKGFVDVDQLFLVRPPDFLIFLCPAFSQTSDKFDLLVSKVDRWMCNQFVTTIISSQVASKNHVPSLSSKQDLAGELRKISSQLVWVDDAVDLDAIFSALRFFS